MYIEHLIAWALLYTLGIAVIFYSIGVSDGRKDGYLRGRSAGMRIAKDRQVNR